MNDIDPQQVRESWNYLMEAVGKLRPRFDEAQILTHHVRMIGLACGALQGPPNQQFLDVPSGDLDSQEEKAAVPEEKPKKGHR